jgi:hypothetical protein
LCQIHIAKKLSGLTNLKASRGFGSDDDKTVTYHKDAHTTQTETLKSLYLKGGYLPLGGKNPLSDRKFDETNRGPR